MAIITDPMGRKRCARVRWRAVNCPLQSPRSRRKAEIGAPGEFDALSDDELERAVRERFNALGLTPDAGSDRLN